MTEENSVLLNIKDGVAHVRLNRPSVHNAFDDTAIARLDTVLSDIAQRDDVFALVLRGNGKSFSAGADLNWMARAATYTEDQNYADALKLAQMLNKLYTLPQATIACVHGAAMGGGFGLVACCDIVIATPEASFALSEVKLGLIPATIAPYVLNAIGTRAFRRYAQTGERFNADRALELGLVQDIAANIDEMEKLTEKLLETLKANGRNAMRESKKLAADFGGKEIGADIMTATARRIAAIRSGSEAKERIAAFLSKK
jgi:methylglutaconyl-CoA hydratase